MREYCSVMRIVNKSDARRCQDRATVYAKCLSHFSFDVTRRILSDSSLLMLTPREEKAEHDDRDLRHDRSLF